VLDTYTRLRVRLGGFQVGSCCTCRGKLARGLSNESTSACGSYWSDSGCFGMREIGRGPVRAGRGILSTPCARRLRAPTYLRGGVSGLHCNIPRLKPRTSTKTLGPAPWSRGRLLVASSVRDSDGGLPGRLLGDSALEIRGGGVERRRVGGVEMSKSWVLIGRNHRPTRGRRTSLGAAGHGKPNEAEFAACPSP